MLATWSSFSTESAAQRRSATSEATTQHNASAAQGGHTRTAVHCAERKPAFRSSSSDRRPHATVTRCVHKAQHACAAGTVALCSVFTAASTASVVAVTVKQERCGSEQLHRGFKYGRVAGTENVQHLPRDGQVETAPPAHTQESVMHA